MQKVTYRRPHAIINSNQWNYYCIVQEEIQTSVPMYASKLVHKRNPECKFMDNDKLVKDLNTVVQKCRSGVPFRLMDHPLPQAILRRIEKNRLFTKRSIQAGIKQRAFPLVEGPQLQASVTSLIRLAEMDAVIKSIPKNLVNRLAPFLMCIYSMYDAKSYAGWTTTIGNYLLQATGLKFTDFIYEFKEIVSKAFNAIKDKVKDKLHLQNGLEKLDDYPDSDCGSDFIELSDDYSPYDVKRDNFDTVPEDKGDKMNDAFQYMYDNLTDVRKIMSSEYSGVFAIIVSYMIIKPLAKEKDSSIVNSTMYTAFAAVIATTLTQNNPLDLASACLQCLVKFLSCGYNFIVDGQWKSKVTKSVSYADWVESIQWLKLKESMVSVAEREGYIPQMLYIHKLTRAIELGMDFKKQYTDNRSSRIPRSEILRYIRELWKIKLTFDRRKQKQSNKVPPLAFLLIGGSSVGKSGVSKLISRQYHETTYPSILWNPEFNWAFNIYDKYCSGYSNQPYITADELAAKRGEIDQEGILILLQMLNEQEAYAVMAEAEDKGKYIFSLELCVATTNVAHLNVKHHFSYPVAMLRRFDYNIFVDVKEEFRQGKAGGINDEAVQEYFEKHGERPEIHIMTIKKTVIGDSSSEIAYTQTKYGDYIWRGSNKTAFCKVIARLTKEHHEKNNRNSEAKSADYVHRCACGVPMTVKCSCVRPEIKLQSYVSKFKIFRFWLHILSHIFYYSASFVGIMNVFTFFLFSKYFDRMFNWLDIKYIYCTLVLGTEDKRVRDKRLSSAFYGDAVLVLAGLTALLAVYKVVTFKATIYEKERYDARDVENRKNFGNEAADCMRLGKTITDKIRKRSYKQRDLEREEFGSGPFTNADLPPFSPMDVMNRKLYGEKAARFLRQGLAAPKYFEYEDELSDDVREANYKFNVEFYGSYIADMVKRGEYPDKEMLIKLPINENWIFKQQAKVENVSDFQEEIDKRIENLGNPKVPDNLIRPLFTNNNSWGNIQPNPDIPVGPTPIRSTTVDALKEVVANNTLKLKCWNLNGPVSNGIGTYVGKNLVLTARHVVCEEDTRKLRQHMEMIDSFDTRFKTSLTTHNTWVHPDADQDIAIVMVQDRISRKDIRKYFRDYTHPGDLAVIMVTPSKEVYGCSRVVKNIQLKGRPALPVSRITDVNESSPITMAGDSGTLVITEEPGSGAALYGVHFAGLDYRAHSVHVSPKLFATALKYFEETSHKLSFAPTIDIPDFPALQAKVSRRTYINMQGGCQYLGKHPDLNKAFNSTNVVKTRFYKSAQEHLGECAFTAPNFKPYQDSNGVWHDAFTTNLRARLTSGQGLDAARLNRAKLDYMNPILSEIKRQHAKTPIVPLTLHEAINGIPGRKFIDSINKGTGAGFPFAGTKRNYLVPIEGTDEHTLNDEAQALFDHYKSELDAGNSLFVIFKTSLKDEAITKQKNQVRKIRNFAASNFVFNLFIRMYFLPLATFLHEHPLLSEMMPGIDCTSEAWHKLAMHLHELACAFDFDFMGFDTACRGELMSVSGEFFIEMAIAIEYPMNILRHMILLLSSVIYPILSYEGELFLLYGTNPSGQALTVQFNSIINSILMRYCFYTRSRMWLRFRTWVRMVTYGDDNIVCVDPRIVDEFNSKTIADSLGYFGIVITNADKTSPDGVPKNLSQIEFLKRGFLSIDGTTLAPLVVKSLRKSLCFRRNSREVSEIQHHRDIIMSYIFERAQYGRDVFKTETAWAISIYNRAFPGDRHEFDVPSWEEIVKRGTILTDRSVADRSTTIVNISDGDKSNSAISELVEKALASLEGLFNPPIALDASKIKDSVHSCKSDAQLQSKTGHIVTNQIPTTNNTTTTNHNANTLEPNESISNLPTTVEETFEVQEPHILSFTEEQPSITVAVDGRGNDILSANKYSTTDLDEFFARPRKLFTQDWNAGFPFTAHFDPFRDFFNNPIARNKLSHYSYMKADIHVKMVINGTPFHYGMIMAGGHPMPDENIIHDTEFYYASEHTKLSCRPNVRAFANDNQTMNLVLPFIYPHNYVKITDALNGVVKLWNVNMLSFSDLELASATASPSINVTVFAWATNVELVVPTAAELQSSVDSKISSQQATENTAGIFESTAAKASEIVGMATKIPIIGDVAEEAKGIIDVFQGAAHFFGWSRPVAPEVTEYFKPKPFSSIAYTAGAETVDKLTLASDNMTSVDPAIVGSSSMDEMAFSSIQTRPAFLRQFTWNASIESGQDVGEIAVDPTASVYESPTLFLHTPLASVAHPFTYWSGTIKYRLEFIKSSFHHGKIKIAWEPRDASPSLDYNTSWSQVIDIADSQDVEFEVPFSQSVNYKEVAHPPSNKGGTWIEHECNGQLTFTVVNKLVSSNSVAPVYINVYISAGDDFEVQKPYDNALRHLLTGHVNPEPAAEAFAEPELQADIGNMGAPTSIPLFGELLSQEAQATRVATFFGEKPTSFRTLLKRYNELYPVASNLGNSAETGMFHTSFHLYNWPVHAGYDERAQCKVLDTTHGTRFNYAPMTMFEYVNNMFCFRRGSIRYKYIMVPKGIIPKIQSVNLSNAIRDSEIGLIQIMLTSGTNPGLLGVDYEVHKKCNVWGGATLTSSDMNDALEIEIPYYDHVRFRNSTTGSPQPSGMHFVEAVGPGEGSYKEVMLMRYQATGEDYSVYYYMGPVQLSTSPIPVPLP